MANFCCCRLYNLIVAAFVATNSLNRSENRLPSSQEAEYLLSTRSGRSYQSVVVRPIPDLPWPWQLDFINAPSSHITSETAFRHYMQSIATHIFRTSQLEEDLAPPRVTVMALLEAARTLPMTVDSHLIFWTVLMQNYFCPAFEEDLDDYFAFILQELKGSSIDENQIILPIRAWLMFSNNYLPHRTVDFITALLKKGVVGDTLGMQLAQFFFSMTYVKTDHASWDSLAQYACRAIVLYQGQLLAFPTVWLDAPEMLREWIMNEASFTPTQRRRYLRFLMLAPIQHALLGYNILSEHYIARVLSNLGTDHSVFIDLELIIRYSRQCRPLNEATFNNFEAAIFSQYMADLDWNELLAQILTWGDDHLFNVVEIGLKYYNGQKTYDSYILDKLTYYAQDGSISVDMNMFTLLLAYHPITYSTYCSWFKHSQPLFTNILADIVLAVEQVPMASVRKLTSWSRPTHSHFQARLEMDGAYLQYAMQIFLCRQRNVPICETLSGLLMIDEWDWRELILATNLYLSGTFSRAHRGELLTPP